jgi:hypothetical protein
MHQGRAVVLSRQQLSLLAAGGEEKHGEQGGKERGAMNQGQPMNSNRMRTCSRMDLPEGICTVISDAEKSFPTVRYAPGLGTIQRNMLSLLVATKQADVRGDAEQLLYATEPGQARTTHPQIHRPQCSFITPTRWCYEVFLLAMLPAHNGLGRAEYACRRRDNIPSCTLKAGFAFLEMTCASGGRQFKGRSPSPCATARGARIPEQGTLRISIRKGKYDVTSNASNTHRPVENNRSAPTLPTLCSQKREYVQRNCGFMSPGRPSDLEQKQRCRKRLSSIVRGDRSGHVLV